MTIQRSHESNSSNTQTTNKNTIALFGEVLADVFPDRSVLGGAPYNVARHLQVFGQHPVLVSRVGNDALRDELLAEMTRLGMDGSGMQFDVNHPTGQVIVDIDENGHHFEILPDQAYDHIHAGVTHLITMKIQPNMVYFGTLAQRSLASRLALDVFLSETKSPRFLDLNLRKPWYDKHIIRRSLLRADVVKVNEEELLLVADLLKLSGTPGRGHGLGLIEKFNLDYLLVTCGADGAWMLAKDGTETHATGQKPHGDLVDTVGAGDGFSAICMLGLLANWPAELMLARANAFAAALCGIRGAVPDNLDFYRPFFEDNT
ncbi:MAG: PfkB family carbohydrate kinase [Methylotenera sp.]